MSNGYQKYPVQLKHLGVIELSFKRNIDALPLDSNEEAAEGFNFTAGSSAFDPEDNTIQVMVMAEIDDNKFKLRAQLIGIFELEDNSFLPNIERWAEVNAPLVLYPYLREQVYGLATRAGIPAPLLPLFQIPSFKQYKD